MNAYSNSNSNNGSAWNKYQPFKLPNIQSNSTPPPVTNFQNWSSPADAIQNNDANFSFDPKSFNYGAQNTPGVTPPGAGSGGFGEWAWGKDGNAGNLAPTLNAASGLAQGYLGYKSLKLGEDQFDFSKQRYNQETGAQAQVYNTNLQDRKSALIQNDQGLKPGTPEFEAALKSYVDNNSISVDAL